MLTQNLLIISFTPKQTCTNYIIDTHFTLLIVINLRLKQFSWIWKISNQIKDFFKWVGLICAQSCHFDWLSDIFWHRRCLHTKQKNSDKNLKTILKILLWTKSEFLLIEKGTDEGSFIFKPSLDVVLVCKIKSLTMNVNKKRKLGKVLPTTNNDNDNKR